MSDPIAQARAFVAGSHLGKSTYRELDRAIGLMRALIEHAEQVERERDELREEAEARLREAEACIEAVEDELDRLEKACVAVPSKKFFRATIDTYKPTTENGSER